MAVMHANSVAMGVPELALHCTAWSNLPVRITLQRPTMPQSPHSHIDILSRKQHPHSSCAHADSGRLQLQDGRL
jgi:hypothetical protein